MTSTTLFAASRMVTVVSGASSMMVCPSSLTRGWPSIVTLPTKAPVASVSSWTPVKWTERGPVGSHVPTWAPVKVTPCGPAWAVGTPWMLVPSAEKTARAGPVGAATIQAPTIGWLASASAVDSWADTSNAASRSAGEFPAPSVPPTNATASAATVAIVRSPPPRNFVSIAVSSVAVARGLRPPGSLSPRVVLQSDDEAGAAHPGTYGVFAGAQENQEIRDQTRP